MQEFFMDYGLWLLIALLVVIGLVVLLSGRNKGAADASDGADGLGVVPENVSPAMPAEPSDVPPVPVIATPLDPLPNPIVPAPLASEIEPQPAEDKPVEPVRADPVPSQPVSETPVPAAPAAASSDADDLLKLKGVGPKLRTQLIELGVTRYAQIAAWTDSDIAAIDSRLGNFKGRPVRDQWVDQAKYLAAGDIAGFEAKYGKL